MNDSATLNVGSTSASAASPELRRPVSTKSDLLRLLSKNERRLRSYDVQRLGFFGSFQRDQPTSESDVDLYVEFVPGQATFDHLMELGDFCEIILGRRVEIVTPNSLSRHLAASILRDLEYVLR